MTTTTTDFRPLTGTYTIDASHSRIGFVARHAMVTKVRGSFNDFEGTATIDGQTPSNSSVQVTINVESIDTRNAQRDDHIRTNDFLDVATYPQITFVSTSVEHVGGDDFGTFNVTGDLTIRGVTKSVTIPLEYQGSASDPFGNARVGFEGSVVINRKDWGVNWNAALETGGVLVSEKVTLEFEISAIKSA
ncbi:MAG TPA: YceI family protein [Jatrophihabitans sp.]|jgi:polyisoprenoid-binding protein YceI